MGKGSKRRPTDESKVRKNWPFPSYASSQAKRMEKMKATEDRQRK